MADAETGEDNSRGLDLVARALTKIGPHYRYWSTVRTSEGVIDHLIVGPTGVWVIVVANMDLPIAVRDGRLVRGGVDHHVLVKTIERRARCASNHLGIPTRAVLAVPGALVGGSPQAAGRVRVVSSAMLVAYVTGAPSEMPPERLAETRERAEAWKSEPPQVFRRTPITTVSAPSHHGQPGGPPRAEGRRSGQRARRRVELFLLAAVLAAIVYVITSPDRLEVLAEWVAQPFTDTAGDDATHPDPSASAAPTDLVAGPIQMAFVCSELNGTYWMRLSVTDVFAGATQIAVGVNGIERFLGEFQPLQPIEAIADIAPGAPITLAASWTSANGDTPGDLKRSVSAPVEACPVS